MAKLTVNNVGPIKEAELEVKKHTVFIGPQGSGKSTLAKLIAICSDQDIMTDQLSISLPKKLNLDAFLSEKSIVVFKESYYQVLYSKKFLFDFSGSRPERINKAKLILDQKLDELKKLENLLAKAEKNLSENVVDNFTESTINSYNQDVDSAYNDVWNEFSPFPTIYIPAERTLITALSNTVWGLLQRDVNFSRTLISFASDFEKVRETMPNLILPFLNIAFKYYQGVNTIVYKGDKSLKLAESASGYQSVIPMLLVVEYERQQSKRRFIIEEPELNLYPTAQKDLIYSLMGGLQPDIEYKDAEWVITTHSPYVLSSFNTLMLAYKVAQRSDELRAEVEKIIPSRCWINPDEFAAYYVDGGTVRSIISEKTGLIADNELDDVSDDLADEQDKLFALSRSVPRA